MKIAYRVIVSALYLQKFVMLSYLLLRSRDYFKIPRLTGLNMEKRFDISLVFACDTFGPVPSKLGRGMVPLTMTILEVVASTVETDRY